MLAQSSSGTHELNEMFYIQTTIKQHTAVLDEHTTILQACPECVSTL
jgi:hypothetical protein